MNRFAIAVSLVLIGLLAAAQPSAAGQDGAPSFRPVSWERLVNAADEPENRLMYSGTLDAASGEELWHIAVGRRVHAAPISFAVAGTQYVTIAAGNVVYTFGLAD